MTERSAALWMVALLGGLAGCLVQPEFQGADFGDYHAVLMERVRPGAQSLWALAAYDPTFDPRIVGFEAQDGTPSALVDPFPPSYNFTLTSELATVRSFLAQHDPAGAWAVVPGGPDDVELVASTRTSAALFQLTCSVSAVVRAGGGEAALTDSAWCNGPALLGPGTDGNRAVLVSLLSPTLVYDVALDPGPTVTAAPSALALPVDVDAAAIRYVESRTAGVLGVATEAGGAWTYHETGASPLAAAATLTGAPAGSKPVWRGADGALRVVTLTGLYRWDVDGDGSVTTLATSPAPSIDAPWTSSVGPGGALARAEEPNPYDATLQVPTAAQVRLLEGDAFVVHDVPTTPCESTEACRAIGESRIIGVVGDTAPRGVVYEFWSWHLSTLDEDMKGVYYAPIE